jgi:hypothetical protein
MLLIGLALAPTMRAESQGTQPVLYARQAAAMLGPTLWKRVLVIQNASADNGYPRTLGAVVFEMGGILWFYTASDGTQSLSIRHGRAKEDEENLGPLLLRLDSGFSHWECDSANAGLDEKDPIPPNACFIQSIALLRHLLAEKTGSERAKLLSYYVTLRTGPRGHTVLYFESNEGPIIIDPLAPGKPFRVRAVFPGDAKSVATCLRHDISNARWVPIDPADFASGRAGGARYGSN